MTAGAVGCDVTAVYGDVAAGWGVTPACLSRGDLTGTSETYKSHTT